jgi:hypothetical protein
MTGVRIPDHISQVNPADKIADAPGIRWPVCAVSWAGYLGSRG